MNQFFLIITVSALLSEPDAIKSAQARLESLNNILIEYEATEKYTPPPSAIEAAESFNAAAKVRAAAGGSLEELKVISGEQFGKARFFFTQGCARYEMRRGAGKTEISTYLLDRHEVLLQEGGGRLKNPVRGAIRDKGTNKLPVQEVIDYALGLRLYNNDRWLEPSDIQDSIVGLPRSDGYIPVCVKLDRRGGKSIYSEQHNWILDPMNSFRLVTYEVNLLKGAPGESEVSFNKISIDNSSFFEVNGIEIPKEIHWRYFSRAKSDATFVVTECRLKVTSCILGDASNDCNSLRIVWPVGAEVVDERTGTPMIVAESPHVLTDEITSKVATRIAVAEKRRVDRLKPVEVDPKRRRSLLWVLLPKDNDN